MSWLDGVSSGDASMGMTVDRETREIVKKERKQLDDE
jgi:hypothetical protein